MLINREKAIAAVEAEMDKCHKYVLAGLGGEVGIEKNTARYQTARSILAALRALPTVSDGWQLIATSKQDGSAFYVWWPCWYHFPLMAYWKDYQLRLSDSTQPAPPWQLGEPDGPTHWKPLGPLPAPPSE
jgi:hypothetical protein